jgi:hypothetical protein
MQILNGNIQHVTVQNSLQARLEFMGYGFLDIVNHKQNFKGGKGKSRKDMKFEEDEKAW